MAGCYHISLASFDPEAFNYHCLPIFLLSENKKQYSTSIKKEKKGARENDRGHLQRPAGEEGIVNDTAVAAARAPAAVPQYLAPPRVQGAVRKND